MVESDSRRYHVIVINEKTSRKDYATVTPITHAEGCTILRKIPEHRLTRKQLEEVVPRSENRLYDLSRGGRSRQFSELEHFMCVSQLGVDDRAACCALQAGEVVQLGDYELRRHS